MNRLAPRLRGRLLNNLAICSLEVGEANEAVSAASEGLACTPKEDRSIVLTTLAAAYLRLGRHADALPLLDEAMHLPSERSNLARTSLFRGDALSALGRGAEAREAFERAIELAPQGSSARTARERIAAMKPYRS